MPKGAAPDPLGKVDMGQVGKWAAQTEVQAGSGFARRGGKWKLDLATLDNEADALGLYDRARAAGYAVRLKPRAGEGGTYRYTVRAMQLPTQAEAVMLAAKLEHLLELAAPVVTRY